MKIISWMEERARCDTRNKWKYRRCEGSNVRSAACVTKNRGSLVIGGLYDKERCVLGRTKDIRIKSSSDRVRGK
jgi:hypothetical protein